MKTEIQFTKNFATKKKGDIWKCDGILASRLIHEQKVAKKVKKVAEKNGSNN